MRLACALLLLAAIIAAPGLARAQSPPVTIFAGRAQSLGYCQLTSLSAATALTSCTGGIPAGTNFADIIVEAQGIRYRTDGTAPTSSVGMPLTSGTDKVFALMDLTKFQAIQTTAGAALDIEFFK